MDDSFNRNKFTLQPGIVNKKNELPDPSELVCIDVPKVFDQCLFKRCLTFAEGDDTNITDEELRSNPLKNPENFLGCRDFKIKLLSVNKIPIKNSHGYKKVVISFRISFCADFIDTNNTMQSELFEINRTELIPKFYLPDPISQKSVSFLPINNTNSTVDSQIVKLEIVAECLEGVLTKDENNCDVLDIALGFHLIVKAELMVQLLVPTFNYCPIPNSCEEEPFEEPCERFDKAPVPKFYPDQKLQPLFPDDNTDDDTDDNYDDYDDDY